MWSAHMVKSSDFSLCARQRGRVERALRDDSSRHQYRLWFIECILLPPFFSHFLDSSPPLPCLWAECNQRSYIAGACGCCWFVEGSAKYFVSKYRIASSARGECGAVVEVGELWPFIGAVGDKGGRPVA